MMCSTLHNVPSGTSKKLELSILKKEKRIFCVFFKNTFGYHYSKMKMNDKQIFMSYFYQVREKDNSCSMLYRSFGFNEKVS